jgi:hypothetical protein
VKPFWLSWTSNGPLGGVAGGTEWGYEVTAKQGTATGQYSIEFSFVHINDGNFIVDPVTREFDVAHTPAVDTTEVEVPVAQ